MDQQVDIAIIGSGFSGLGMAIAVALDYPGTENGHDDRPHEWPVITTEGGLQRDPHFAADPSEISWFIVNCKG